MLDEHRSETVTVVTGPDWEWELRLDRTGQLIDFRMSGFGKPVDETVLVHVPLADLVRIARAFAERVKANLADTGDLRDALLVSELDSTDTRRTLDGSPDAETLARAWHDIGPRTITGVPRRLALAAMFSASPYTVDGWIKRIRKERPGLIPPANTGRGNRRQPKYQGKDG